MIAAPQKPKLVFWHKMAVQAVRHIASSKVPLAHHTLLITIKCVEGLLSDHRDVPTVEYYHCCMYHHHWISIVVIERVDYISFYSFFQMQVMMLMHNECHNECHLERADYVSTVQSVCQGDSGDVLAAFSINVPVYTHVVITWSLLVTIFQ